MRRTQHLKETSLRSFTYTAVSTLAGLTVAILTYGVLGPVAAGIVFIAVLCHAFAGDGALGNTPIGDVPVAAPEEIRRYRREHPGTTISEAIAILGRR
ncbi:hypothetical protein [Curtobacterium sp. ISL-83]|uniref:hypothetical protein n=1 Tax=Curtobacterium sp. ISL-83 TaxID=2819145 RepID=UPI001BE9469B|nr:hypothetical protein [Curtobacterium sp. ISL-83]MBT2503768.1 hypothetical protein [Curtobacterium sp. ISL-83]